MSLDLGELRIGLGLDRDELRRDIAAARADMEGLSASAQREVTAVSATLTAQGKSAGNAFSEGVAGGADGANRLVDGIQGRLHGAAPELERAGEDIGRNVGDGVGRGGEDAGGKLAQGINAGLIRNSPLIAAAVSGALIAGAPAAIAGAGLLFGGIAAVALKSNADLAMSWAKLGDQLKTGAASDAAVLIPTYQHMADQIGATFESLRPQMREAFADTRPLIDDVTDGVDALATNAMPGLVKAVGAAEPVFAGLESFLAKTGTGLSEMFSVISDHAPSAGGALDDLGSIIGDALPLIGELLGEGAELAHTVLPPVAAAFGAVASAAEALGPLLPVVLTGFLAYKAVAGIAGAVDAFTASIGRAAAAEEVAAATSTKAAAPVSALGGFLRGLGPAAMVAAAGYGIYSTMLQHEAENQAAATDQLSKWMIALQQGGTGAAEAGKKLQDYRDNADALKKKIDELGNSQQTGGYMAADQEAKLRQLNDQYADAKKKADDYTASLTPLQYAQATIASTQTALDDAIAAHGPLSDQAQAAVQGLAAAQGQAAQAALDEASAIAGVNAGLVQEASLTLAQAGNDLARREALTGVDVAFQSMNTTMADAKSTTDDITQSQQQFEGAILGAAQAAGSLASNTLPATTDATTKANAANAAQLATLLQLRDQYGADFPASLQATIGQLQGTVSAGSLATAQFGNLGLTIAGVPNSKTVIVSSTTPEVDAQLSALGYHVEHLPDGTVQLTALTQAAEDALNNTARNRTSTVTQVVQYTGTGINVNGKQIANATGNILHAYANGGMEPMAGGVARVVPPNTLRVIGDRVKDDEAYIPINSSARSLSILGETARRMGYGLASGVGGSSSSDSSGGPRTVIYDNRQVYAQVDASKLSRQMREDQRDQEFLAGVS